MNNTHHYYKFEVGQRVRVREDLRVGKEYFSKDRKHRNVFARNMEQHKGKVVEIIGRRQGQYIIEGDHIHLYTDSMFVDLTAEDDAEFARADYVFNEEVETVLDVVMKEQVLRAIDLALDQRLYETNPEEFQNLVKQL